jgi:hypothetical protein
MNEFFKQQALYVTHFFHAEKCVLFVCAKDERHFLSNKKNRHLLGIRSTIIQKNDKNLLKKDKEKSKNNGTIDKVCEKHSLGSIDQIETI